jgi:hypothetical protein
MVFQVEDHVVHGDPPLEDYSARVGQDEARLQAEHQMAIGGVFIMTLAGVGSQQRLEEATYLRN